MSKDPQEAKGRVLPPFPTQKDINWVPQPLDRTTKAPSDHQEHALPGFLFTEGHPRNRKGFRYDPCVPNLTMPSLLYTKCETDTVTAGPSYLDRSIFVGFTEDGVFSTDKGYRSVRANCCIRGAGRWYFEIPVIKANEGEAHVRLGIARREMSVEAPVGSDIYSYGVQDSQGSQVHAARPEQFMEPFGSGDVIGFEVCIPRSSLPTDVIRRQYPVKFKDRLFFEEVDYRAPHKRDYLLPNKYRPPEPQDLISGSYLKIYKNGLLQGTIDGLREFLPPHSHYDAAYRFVAADDGMLGYFPVISVYKGGQAKFNLGPDFSYWPEDFGDAVAPLSERFDEQIADDVVLDIVDEVVFEEIDAQNPQAARQEALENQQDPSDSVPAADVRTGPANGLPPSQLALPGSELPALQPRQTAWIGESEKPKEENPETSRAEGSQIGIGVESTIGNVEDQPATNAKSNEMQAIRDTMQDRVSNNTKREKHLDANGSINGVSVVESSMNHTNNNTHISETPLQSDTNGIDVIMSPHQDPPSDSHNVSMQSMLASTTGATVENDDSKMEQD